jgi:hypothetical protein
MGIHPQINRTKKGLGRSSGSRSIRTSNSYLAEYYCGRTSIELHRAFQISCELIGMPEMRS